MREMGKFDLITTTHANGLRLPQLVINPPSISLAEHDRTLNLVLAENARMKVERVRVVAALTAFRDAHWSVASANTLLDLLEELEGPKETPCPQ